MSFLNPVNEPVLRFKSTDAGAPQINQNARAAGDVKAVLKACLVTGYGSKASAGWSVVDDVANAAKFTAPTAAMSDYKIGIDDGAAANTVWYYQYQDVRYNPSNNTIDRNSTDIDKTGNNNGWELLVTNRGVCFIEIFHVTALNDAATRITYFGQVKSALIADTSINMGFIVFGWNSPQYWTSYIFGADNGNRYYRLGEYSAVGFSSSNLPLLTNLNSSSGITAFDLVSSLYLVSNNILIGQQPALLAAKQSDSVKARGVSVVNIDNRPTLSCYITPMSSDIPTMNQYARNIFIYLDYWEY